MLSVDVCQRCRASVSDDRLDAVNLMGQRFVGRVDEKLTAFLNLNLSLARVNAMLRIETDQISTVSLVRAR